MILDWPMIQLSYFRLFHVEYDGLCLNLIFRQSVMAIFVRVFCLKEGDESYRYDDELIFKCG